MDVFISPFIRGEIRKLLESTIVAGKMLGYKVRNVQQSNQRFYFEKEDNGWFSDTEYCLVFEFFGAELDCIEWRAFEELGRPTYAWRYHTIEDQREMFKKFMDKL